MRCCGYDTFGTESLANKVVDAMQDRTACLMANHGMIAAGDGLDQAMWRAQELETLAKQYCLASQNGEPVILSEEDIQITLKAFSGYGVKGSA